MTERDAPHPDGDEFRHVREVLAKRTPDSILMVNRYGMGINSRATGKAVTVLMRKQDDPNHAQADNDLDALSVLWNAADELLTMVDEAREDATCLRIDSDEAFSLLAEYQRGRGAIPADDPVAEAMDLLGGEGNHAAQLRADSAELARERRRAAALRTALEIVLHAGNAAYNASGAGVTTFREYHLERVIDTAADALAADAPGQGGEGEGR